MWSLLYIAITQNKGKGLNFPDSVEKVKPFIF